jgi:hypothetical protein
VYSNGSWAPSQRFKYYPKAGSCPGEVAHEYTIFNLSPGTYDFYAHAAGYLRKVYRNITIPCTLDITLEPEAKISGTVTVDGNAAERVDVSAYDSTNTPCGIGGITDANGSYTITGMPAGTYSVKAINPGYDFTSCQGVVTVGGQTTSGINLTGTPEPPLPTGVLSGTVSIVSVGTGIGGAFVTVYDNENNPTNSATTDANGYYQVQYLAGGTYTVKVDYGYFDIVQVQNVVVTNGQTTTQNLSVSIYSYVRSVLGVF